MQCVLPQGPTTPEKFLSNPWHGKSFYEPNQYKCAIDRCEAGYRSCEIAIEMFKSFAELQARHAADIRRWSAACLTQIRQSKEFGTNKNTWISCIRATELTAKRHDALAENTQKNVVDKMVSYKHDHYARSFLQIRVTKEFERQFKAAQRSWLKALAELEQANQTYLECKRKLKDAELSENYVRTNDGSTEEEMQQVNRIVEKRRKDAAQQKRKYEQLNDDLEKKRPAYEESMTEILERTHEFERKRGNHFKLMFIALQDALGEETDESSGEICQAFQKAIANHDTEKDIKFWNDHYGSETKTSASSSGKLK